MVFSIVKGDTEELKSQADSQVQKPTWKQRFVLKTTGGDGIPHL